MGTELTRQDRCDWNLHKAICKRNKDGVIETAKSLKIIRDRKLWRAEYESFEAFAEGIYGHTLRWANLLIADISPKHVDASSTKPQPALPSGQKMEEISKNGPNTTENTDSAPDAPKNTVSEPPKAPPKPPDPFKKLDELIGKAIRATDEIGEGENHDNCLSLFNELMHEIKRWRAAA